jgi:hypothetical protein
MEYDTNNGDVLRHHFLDLGRTHIIQAHKSRIKVNIE